MENPSESNDLNAKPSYTRIGILGAIVGIIAIVTFLGLWFLFEDVDTLPRLVIAVCVPPGIMTLIIGGYIVSGQSNKSA